MSMFTSFGVVDLDAPATAEAPPSLNLDIDVGLQPNQNWCWACVASAISMFLDSGSTWTQCALANAAFGDSARCDCCNDVSSPICDNRYHLIDAMTNFTHNLKQSFPGPIGAAEIRQELQRGLPVGVRIRFPGDTDDGGHDVIIGGIGQDSEGQDIVIVADPALEGVSSWPISDLSDNYGTGGGQWVETYTTKPRSE
jgi:Papain-like cysteine protease AvrRpt2